MGREDELTSFDALLARLERGATEQSMIITGLRGVGKTVLLGAFRSKAEAGRWATAEAEITKNSEFGANMGQLARRSLLQIAPRARWGDRARRAASVIKPFSLTLRPDGSLNAGFDFEPAEGLADSGDFTEDLKDLFVALGEAARAHGTGVVFLFDEVQFLGVTQFEALMAALQKTAQRNLPITLVAAGLPQIPRLAGEAKSYAERLFRFPAIGELAGPDATAALVVPAEALGVAYTSDAVAAIVSYTEGYPYFLQEYGKIVWDEAADSPITAEDVVGAQPLVEEKLDGGFFRVRAERTTELELAYLRAMAELGPNPQSASNVAVVLGRTCEQLAPIRARLVEKGLLYTPGYGLAAFTVPQLHQYMIRNHPPIVTPPKTRRPRADR
ncbi:MAG: ATP-binding protein [Acidimicrobiales bacterium]